MLAYLIGSLSWLILIGMFLIGLLSGSFLTVILFIKIQLENRRLKLEVKVSKCITKILIWNFVIYTKGIKMLNYLFGGKVSKSTDPNTKIISHIESITITDSHRLCFNPGILYDGCPHRWRSNFPLLLQAWGAESQE